MKPEVGHAETKVQSGFLRLRRSSWSGGAGFRWHNAAMESFFSSLKTERTARKIYQTRNEAKADVFDYIERFYNRASEDPSVYVVEEKRLC
jgi:Integrase core domain